MATSDFEFAFLLIGVFLTLIKVSQVVSRKFGLPDVLGELVTGIIMGPTVLGVLYLKSVPTSSLSDILHVDQFHVELTATVINFISEFAVLLLLFKVGMEVDFDDLKKVKTPAFITASMGIFLPLIGGFFLVYGVISIAPIYLIPEGISYVNAAIFLGATLTATSIGISTRLFLDLDKMRTKVAQTVVGSAIIDDIIAVALFSVIVAYLGDTQGSVSIISILINIIIFFFVSFLLFKYGIPYFMTKTKKYSDSTIPVFVSIAFMLYMAVFAQALGLAPIIGAFVAGVIIGKDDYLDVHRDFEPVTSWIIPFFFLDIGLSVNLGDVLDPQAFLIAMIIVIVAISSKFIAGFVGTYFQGYTKGESWTTGLSMAARGEVTLIFAFTGYSYGYFSELLYGIIILAVVLIIFILIPTMKYAVKNWLPGLEYAPIGGD